MIQRIVIKGSAKAGTTAADISEVTAAVVFNSAHETLKWTKSSTGWKLTIPCHKHNKLTGIWGGPDLMIGKASIKANGAFKTELMLGWTAQEMILGETLTDALLLTKTQVVHRVRTLERIAQAEQRLHQAERTCDELEQQVQQADRESSELCDMLRQARSEMMKARCELRSAQKAYPEHVSSGDYSSQAEIYKHGMLRLIDDRKRGVSPYLLLPQQVEAIINGVLVLLMANIPFLDPQALRVTEADAFFQWVLPDPVDFFSVLRHRIISETSTSQKIDITKPGIIKVLRDRYHQGVTLENISLPELPKNLGLLRLYADLSRLGPRSRPVFDLSGADGNGITIDWAAIVNHLREVTSQLPVVTYPNDLELLTRPERNASRALAFDDHPEVWQHYLRRRNRPNKRLRELYPRRWHPAPDLRIPDCEEMQEVDLESLVAAWLPDGSPLLLV